MESTLMARLWLMASGCVADGAWYCDDPFMSCTCKRRSKWSYCQYKYSQFMVTFHQKSSVFNFIAFESAVYRRNNICGSKRESKHERTPIHVHMYKSTMFQMRNEVNRWIGENGMVVRVFASLVKKIIMIKYVIIPNSLNRSMRLPELNTYTMKRGTLNVKRVFGLHWNGIAQKTLMFIYCL